MYKTISRCRICGNTELVPILDLGTQALTGVFPKATEVSVPITTGPLILVKCNESPDGNSCGLVQLADIYDMSELYGLNYGYRSGLNSSMAAHLRTITDSLLAHYPPKEGDLILDIGSNDGTLLSGYPADRFTLAGMDPTGIKFKQYYPKQVTLIPEFFSSKSFDTAFGGKKASIVTSIAMFYDMEDPLGFVREVASVLADDGVWFFEQSYMPTMLSENAYDTVCHEHQEYYRLKQITYLLDKAGLVAVDIGFNKINGGSFYCIARKKTITFASHCADALKILKTETATLKLNTLKPYLEFAKTVADHRDALRDTIAAFNKNGVPITGYGASTKGNVILQYCDFTSRDIGCIGEINKDKFGCITPGSQIPIVSEDEAKKASPKQMIVFPWHFKEHIVEREQAYLTSGGSLLFPLPKIEVVRL